MTKFAKIISLFLCLAMVFSVVGAMAISSFAVETPSLALKKVSQDGKTLVVSIDLTKGSFNSMDIVFNMKGLECTGIEQGAAVGSSGAFMYGNPSAPSGKSHISMIAVNGMKTGSIATATFKVTNTDDYSLSISVIDCAVTDSNNENVSVKPTISGNSIAPAKPSSSSSSSSSTSSTTKKTSTTTSTTKKSTTTTTTKKTTTTTTKLDPTATVPTNTLPSSTDVSSSTSEVISSIEDTTSDDFSYDYDDDGYDYYTPDEDENNTPADSDELLDNEKDPKTIIIIAAVAVVLVAGAVVAFVVINKKKNAE